MTTIHELAIDLHVDRDEDTDTIEAQLLALAGTDDSLPAPVTRDTELDDDTARAYTQMLDGDDGTSYDQALSEAGEAAAAVPEAIAERDEAIRRALAAGAPYRELTEATGLRRSQLDNIRRGRRR